MRGEQEYLAGSKPCPVEVAQEIIGGKWKGVILYKLLESGCLRFSELKRRLPRITQRMLTLQLRSLEEDGLVLRTIYPEVPPRVEYRLTELGQTLKPVIDGLMAWGILYEEVTQTEGTAVAKGEAAIC
ncbi:winged helix-turn-helix transcriptional regulator [Endozoicomonas elysicola]|uniref:HxlR family transcriptional regulator n=1 Tax=Endozoicomonas elysicola TaxID=305900 RepID=A0A081K9S2_9GAMM|nr:helix-turn-helix domain-containing protein [Endozoicomonas elysicola]KEI70898.1 HxlR family transcriptional regulator [Endozoicomonas elysicola]